MVKISLSEKLASFSEHWSPRIIAELNGQHVRVVKLLGDFVWHHHDHEDELFLVLHGSLRLHFRDEFGKESRLDLNPGECVVVPRGTEHKPEAPEEVHVLLFEPAATLNTGNVRDHRTIENLQRA